MFATTTTANVGTIRLDIFTPYSTRMEATDQPLGSAACCFACVQSFLAAVMQHESGVPGNYAGKAKRGFTKLARSGTQLEFPQFEKASV